MSKTTAEQNRALVLNAFNTPVNKRDYDTAEQFWSDRYIQHSAHIPAGRNGLFDLIRALPDTLRYENQLIVAEGRLCYRSWSLFGPRPTGRTDRSRYRPRRRWPSRRALGCLADEATEAGSRSGLPMFGDRFPC